MQSQPSSECFTSFRPLWMTLIFTCKNYTYVHIQHSALKLGFYFLLFSQCDLVSSATNTFQKQKSQRHGAYNTCLASRMLLIQNLTEIYFR